jgi:hypothetical protein
MNHRILTLLLALVLLGAGCVPAITDALSDNTDAVETPTTDTNTDIQPEHTDCTETTAHESCIDSDGNDEALIGTWKLDSVTISGAVMDFSGHTLSFDWGSFTTDYSTEEHTFSDTSCYFTGGTNGIYFADSELNPEEITANYLDIAKTEGNITSTCASDETITQVSNMTLGTGIANTAAIIDDAVLYTYTMPDDWSVFILTAAHIPVTYTYSRID